MRLVNDMTKASGTGKLADLNASYEDLTKILGEPLEGSGDGKVRAGWVVELDNGTHVWIHDYKDYNTPVSRLNWWSVNAKNMGVAGYFLASFNKEKRYKEMFGA